MLVLFFSYGHFYNALKDFSIGGLTIERHRYFLLTAGILFISGVYLTRRTHHHLNDFTNILNIIGASLIAISLIQIGIFKLNTYKLNKSVPVPGSKRTQHAVDLANPATLPDVYYIILDGYANANTLKESYDYDNQEFVDYLTDKGFYVASESRSNYGFTYLSLASSLNMQYLDTLSDTLGVESKDRTAPIQMTKNNEVMHFLRSRGYQFIHFRSGHTMSNRNEYADQEIECSSLLGSEFLRVLIETTMLDPLALKLEYYLRVNSVRFANDRIRERVLCTFSELAEVPHWRIERPRFVFAHIVVPHGPYVFGPDGEPRYEIEDLQQAYLDQLTFVNKKVKVLIEKILSESDPLPIILLQADHGWSLSGTWDQPSQRFLKETMGILNAYYLPNANNGKDLLYDSITPVNTFRLVFNHYFGASYNLLDDRSYYSHPYEQPYKFVDVTDILIGEYSTEAR